MRDQEVVASIVAGDPAGLAEAYDKYARVLYSYGKTFLREPADAADVVHDTFVIAAGNLDPLRDPARAATATPPPAARCWWRAPDVTNAPRWTACSASGTES